MGEESLEPHRPVQVAQGASLCSSESHRFLVVNDLPPEVVIIISGSTFIAITYSHVAGGKLLVVATAVVVLI